MLSTQVAAILDLRVFEIRLKGSRLTSAGVGNQSAALSTVMNEDRNVFGFEIARYYISPGHHFGRLAIEALESYPAGLHWARLGLQTGILPSTTSPWGFRLNTQVITSFSGRSAYILINGEIDRQLTETFTVGGHLGWTDRTNNELAGFTRWEYMSFALGPLLRWKASWATIQFDATAKWWIDRERVAVPSGESLQSPSDIQPALALHVWIPL